ncbi:hypothetical protein OG716_32925 [Nocardia sp. NBC_01388]
MLGRAEERLTTGGDAGELIAQARTGSKEALTELRELVRGIHRPHWIWDWRPPWKPWPPGARYRWNCGCCCAPAPPSRPSPTSGWPNCSPMW